RILRLEGVADVDLQGVQSREILIELDRQLMSSLGVDITAVKASLRGNNLNLSAGSISDGERRYLVRSMGEFANVQEIADLPVRGTAVKLGDVGTVSYRYPEKTYYQRLNQKDAVSLRVYKSSTANIVEVSGRVRKVIDELTKDGGLAKLTVHIFFDQATEITDSLTNLRNAGIAGGCLAIVMLFLFLLRFKSTIIIASAIPISILCTFTFMFLIRRFSEMNITLNIISLSGLMLAVGMLVDNSVVVLENIYRHREEGLGAMEAATKGAKEVGMPVLAATATTIIVFVPLLFTSRSTFGRFMQDFGLSIVIALVASLFVAMTLVPLIASRLLTGQEKGKHRVIRWLIAGYTVIVKWTTKHRLITIGAFLLVLGGGLYLFTQIEREFIPPTPSRRMDLSINAPRSYAVKDTAPVIDQLENILMENKDELEIKIVSSNFHDNHGRTTIFFKDMGESKNNTQALWAKVRKVLPEIPGVEIKVGQMFGMGGGSELSVSVDIKGPDGDVLAILAEDVKNHLKSLPGITDLDTSLESGEEEIRLTVNRSKAAKYGLSAWQVAQLVSSNLADSKTGYFKTQDEEVPITVGIRDEDKETLDQLKQIRMKAGGVSVPLGTLVDYRYKQGPDQIQKDKGDKVITVSGNLEKRGMSGLQKQVDERMRTLELPPGYSWEMGRSFRKFQETEETSRFAILLAVLFVYIIMASLFESFIHPITILFSVPFSIIGVSALFYLTKTPLNSSSSLGIMVLFGMVVNNGIILVDHINQLRAAGMSRREAIILGGQNRLRPILMTASTTLLGMLPMVAPILLPGLFGPIEGRAGTYGPIALALVGGLITSTFFTLVITPTLYSLMDDLGRFLKKVVGSV
ncbi:MAG TPA: efflux RND transporter permease subunit, partial [Spirochaetia bacterium]|nr:efflux RND transporter permease subunit [Spirochaetia bacterium]